MKKLMLMMAGALLIVASTVLSTNTIVNAQSAQSAQSIPCGDRGKIIDRLKSVYAEEPVSIGLMVNGSIIEVYASNDGTFTVLITSPDGPHVWLHRVIAGNNCP